MAAVERDPYFVDRHQPGRIVDAHLDHLSSVTEPHGGTDGAATMLAALGFRRAGESSLHGECAPVDQRRSDNFGEGQRRLIASTDAKRFADAFNLFRAGLELACRGGAT